MSEEMMNRDLSNCEQVIMKAIWEAKEDISTPELIQVLKLRYGKDYARTTVVTFVQRLTEKGYVNTYRKGRVSYVHSLKDEQQYKNRFIREATDFWFHGDASILVSTLCAARELSKEEIERIKETLDGLDD